MPGGGRREQRWANKIEFLGGKIDSEAVIGKYSLVVIKPVYLSIVLNESMYPLVEYKSLVLVLRKLNLRDGSKMGL
jgi:hypothetical protein